MDNEDQFLSQVLSGISEAEVVTIFFPLLRRAMVIDARGNEQSAYMVKVMPQVNSMEERIRSIEKLRPQLGKVRSILGVPWMKSVRRLDEHGVTRMLVDKLVSAGATYGEADAAVKAAAEQLWRLEKMAFVRMIRGEGFKTLWTTKR
ncbi:MAG: hypothetical protein M3437_08620 [Chloroflexota bacterium]|nr:hypothetical protein [Chloroflexota bacterium]MDQ5864550.1 hypothetical protein [Chloroflexota bacterium]